MASGRKEISREAETFFEELWQRGDPWSLETSEFERAKYERQIDILRDRHYGRALEIGCGNGCFTRRLSAISDHVAAIDISPSAIERARTAATGIAPADFRVANIMDFDLRAEGSWDLIVMSETIYYGGWLYSFFDVAWLAREIFAATRDNGRLLMANTCGGVDDYLLRPWMIRTYHDLFLNVGYHLQCQETFHGAKDATDIEILISLFGKAA